jgi:hypothetical protein
MFIHINIQTMAVGLFMSNVLQKPIVREPLVFHLDASVPSQFVTNGINENIISCTDAATGMAGLPYIGVSSSIRYSTVGMNLLPTIIFDGTDSIDFGIPPNSARFADGEDVTIFAVIWANQLNANTNIGYLFGSNNHSSPWVGGVLQGVSVGIQDMAKSYSGTISTSTGYTQYTKTFPINPSNQPEIVTFVFNRSLPGNGLSIRRNTRSLKQDTAYSPLEDDWYIVQTGSLKTNPGKIIVGNRSRMIGDNIDDLNHYNGMLSELRVYRGELSELFHTTLVAELALKWNINIKSPSLILHLDASDFTSITDLDTGGGGATQLVSWRDLSENALQGYSADGPSNNVLYDAGGLNGNPTVTFYDGGMVDFGKLTVDQYVDTEDLCIFIVLEPYTFNRGWILGSNQEVLAQPAGFAVAMENNSVLAVLTSVYNYTFYGNSAPFKDTNNPTPPICVAYRFSRQINPGSFHSWVNGIPITSAIASDWDRSSLGSMLTQYSNFVIGNRSTFPLGDFLRGFYSFNGNISEVMMYKSTFSDGEVVAKMNEMMLKWNIE